jgi:hypothetical protein
LDGGSSLYFEKNSSRGNAKQFLAPVTKSSGRLYPSNPKESSDFLFG